MKFKLKKPHLSPLRILRWLPYVTISISVLAFAYSMWFLYQDVFLGIYDTSDLEAKSRNIIKTKLNTQLYDEVQEIFRNRENGTERIESLSNPFNDVNNRGDITPP